MPAATLEGSAIYPSRWRPIFASTFPQLLGVFLIATAALKAFNPAEAAVVSSAYDLPTWLLVAAVQIELMLGAILIAEIRPRAASRAAVLMFAVFASFSLYRGLAGYESCGCFRAIAVSPRWTFAFDSAILAALWIARPGVSRLRSSPIKLPKAFIGGMVYVALSVASVIMMISPASKLESAGQFIGNGGLILLEPAEWVGQEFPVADLLFPRVDLSHGDWVLLMYHHDCPSCLAALPKYEALAEHLGDGGQSGSLLLVEVPPYGGQFASAVSKTHHARLSDGHEWFIQTPIEIRLRNGTVTGASLDLPSIASHP